MCDAGNAPPRVLLSVAVVDRHVRGYPARCLESLGASSPPAGVEYLWITDAASASPFPAVRKIVAREGDRAAAKNIAIAESRGEWILLTTSDMVARRHAAEVMIAFLSGESDPSVASAQILSENGMRRRTAFAFPSLMSEMNPLARLRRLSVVSDSRGRPPRTGRPYRVEAFRAAFLVARREVFDLVGEFRSGYRFGMEDIEWCWRAGRHGVARYVVPEAHAFCLAPQERGRLGPAHHVEISRSIERMVEACRGRKYAMLFRAARRVKWMGALPLLCVLDVVRSGRSPGLRRAVARHCALLGILRDVEALADDAESRVRWEEMI